MNRNRAFAILSAVLISLTCCSDPISHDLQTPEYEYRDRIEVAIGYGVDIQGAWDMIVLDSANAPAGSTELKFKMGKD